jgi:outer membrane protein assembly factor BamB
MCGEIQPIPAQAAVGDQVIKLLPNDGVAMDRFGSSVALSGSIAIVGSQDDENGPASGSAYLFNINDGMFLSKLTPDDAMPSQRMGMTVDISGDYAIVGAFDDSAVAPNSGSAYLFDVTNGSQHLKLIPDDGEERDWFGRAVAIDGTSAIVTADGDGETGSAYVFDVTDGTQIRKLTPIGGVHPSLFGRSADLSGNIAIVGAYQDRELGPLGGAAYLFDITDGSQLFKLLPDDGMERITFGDSVAISGNIAIVGADGADGVAERSGAAYLFDVTSGEQLAKLIPNDGSLEYGFGASVAIDGNIAIVGAYAFGNNRNDSGTAYLFDITTGKQLARLTPDDLLGGEGFGGSVAIRGDTAIIGAFLDDDNGGESGSAYLFSTVPEPNTAILCCLMLVGAMAPRKCWQQRFAR